MFQNNLFTEQLGSQLWRLTENLVWITDTEFIVIPKGFLTDGASIPRAVWWFASPMSGLHSKAAVLHDYLCVYGYDQKRTDKMFIKAMKASGVSILKRQAMYNFVRAYQVAKGEYRINGKEKEDDKLYNGG